MFLSSVQEKELKIIEECALARSYYQEAESSVINHFLGESSELNWASTLNSYETILALGPNPASKMGKFVSSSDLCRA